MAGDIVAHIQLKGDALVEAVDAEGNVGPVHSCNVSPPPNTVENLDAMIALYRERAIVDWNINAAGTVPEEIPGLAARGIAALKVFMVVDTGRDYPHMPGIGVHDHGKLLEIFETVGETGLPLMVHPHDQALMAHIEEGYWKRGERDALAYARAYAAYDGIIWDTATALLLRLQKATGTRLHLLHTQTGSVVEQLRAAKAAGQAVTAELNPWALFLGNDWSTVERLGSYALSYYVPEKHTEPLWAALADGTIDLVSTDHAPHTREEKEPGWIDGWKAHTGTPSTQFYVSLFLDAAAHGRISLERVVDLLATAPARVFGLADKGRLDVGADADIAIVDLDAELEIRDRLDAVRRSASTRRRRNHAGPRARRPRGRRGGRPARLGPPGSAPPLSRPTAGRTAAARTQEGARRRWPPVSVCWFPTSGSRPGRTC
jgi:dihydroorotase